VLPSVFETFLVCNVKLLRCKGWVVVYGLFVCSATRVKEVLIAVLEKILGGESCLIYQGITVCSIPGGATVMCQILWPETNP